MTAVLTAVGRWDSALATALGGSSVVQVVRRCADLADLLATAAAGVGDAAVVSDDLRGMDLSVVAQLRAHGVHVVGLGPPDDEASERRLRQWGITSIITAGSSLDLLESALLERSAVGPARERGVAASVGPDPRPDGPDRAVAEVAPQPPGGLSPRGIVVAVWGPTGSPGRTSVAVTLAAEVAGLGVSTLLVDADTYGACVAQALSLLDEAPGLAAAARAAEHGTLDLPTLARLSPEVCRGMRVITGIPRADRWPEIRPPALERVLELSRLLAQVVVVDCGFCLESDEELSYDTAAPRRNAATLTTLDLADEVLAIGSCDPVGLQRLVRGLQELGAVTPLRPRVVVNRVRAGTVGARPERRVADALERFAGVGDVVFVPDDPAALDAAVREGRSLAECAPSSPVRAAVRALAATVAGVQAGQTRGSRRG